MGRWYGCAVPSTPPCTPPETPGWRRRLGVGLHALRRLPTNPLLVCCLSFVFFVASMRTKYSNDFCPPHSCMMESCRWTRVRGREADARVALTAGQSHHFSSPSAHSA